MLIQSDQTNKVYRAIGIEQHDATNYWYLLYAPEGFDPIDWGNGSRTKPDALKMHWLAEDMTLQDVLASWGSRQFVFVHGEKMPPEMYKDRYTLIPESNEAALSLLQSIHDYE